MKATWSYQDEVFASGVHIVPDFEPEAQPPQYTTMVLLGPPPLTVKEILLGVLLAATAFTSAGIVVTALYLLAKRFL